MVEASCGGGDANGGDEDEDVFEIVNLAPVADFRLSSTFNCVAGQAQRAVTTLDYSNLEGALSYSYKLTDVASGTSSTYTVSQPFFTVDAKKAYDVTLTVTDSKGCTAQKTVRIDAAATCKAKFDWWYSWCDDQCTGTKKVTVNFENQSEFTNCSTPPTYNWDYGDGTTGTVANHVYDVPCNGKSYPVTLTITLGKPGDKDYCQSIWSAIITVEKTKPSVVISKICCDGLVFFQTNSTKGEWNTPGSLGKPGWPVVSKKIWKPLLKQNKLCKGNKKKGTSCSTSPELPDHPFSQQSGRKLAV